MIYYKKDTLLFFAGSLGITFIPQPTQAIQNKTKPNILVIITDQQQAAMMSCAGNKYVKTPNLDKLASQGICFERAYAANPVSIPSRFSLMTGRYPSEINMEDNEHQKNSVPKEMLESALGSVFTKAGYETAYAGKMHLSGSDFDNGLENPLAYGFQKYLTPNDPEGREKTVAACINYIKTSKEKPFLLYTSLINPHDICYMPLMDWSAAEKKKNPYANSKVNQFIQEILKQPDGMSKQDFIDKFCPPLPDNFEIPLHELPSYTTIKANNYIGWSRKNYTESDWRIYRYLYARLTEYVDAQIGEILNGLKEAGLEDNTLVVFTSDHGDQNAAHKTGLKGFLYEESINIPFILKWKNVIPENQIDNSHLISNGLDLLPTLCDFAGIQSNQNFSGLSVRPLALSSKMNKWRSHLLVENNSARLIIFDKTWKYSVDILKMDQDNSENKEKHEMLFNLSTDKGEKNNLVLKEKYNHKLERGRKILSKEYNIN